MVTEGVALVGMMPFVYIEICTVLEYSPLLWLTRCALGMLAVHAGSCCAAEGCVTQLEPAGPPQLHWAGDLLGWTLSAGRSVWLTECVFADHGHSHAPHQVAHRLRLGLRARRIPGLAAMDQGVLQVELAAVLLPDRSGSLRHTGAVLCTRPSALAQPLHRDPALGDRSD